MTNIMSITNNKALQIFIFLLLYFDRINQMTSNNKPVKNTKFSQIPKDLARVT